MPRRYRKPVEPPRGFKQVGKRPPRFQCMFCTTAADDSFVMDRNAMDLHSEQPEHKLKEEEQKNIEWADWNAGAKDWKEVTVRQGRDNGEEEEEPVVWQMPEEKQKRIMKWAGHPTQPLSGFKQVGKGPPQFQCTVCTAAADDLMDRNAMTQHSKRPEHKNKLKEQKQVEWSNWNARVKKSIDLVVGRGWGDGDDEADNDLQRWQATEEESERWQFVEEKQKRIIGWIDSVAAAQKVLEEERRQRKREGKKKAETNKAPTAPK